MTGESHVARAILLFVLSGFFLSSLDATAKALVHEYPVWWVAWARYAGHLLVVIPLAWFKLGPGFWRTRHPLLQFSRSMLLVVATVAYFSALRFLPLAEASAISFLAPLFIVILSGPVLGESVSRQRWISVAAGFSGILLVTRPGSAAFQPATLLMLVMALSNALYQILTRKLTGDSIYTTLVHSALVGAVLFTLLLPILSISPMQPLPGLHDAILFLAIGLFAGIGHWLMIAAFLQAQAASQLTAFAYLQMAWPLLFGWLFFGQFPDGVSIAGMAVIVSAGFWLGWQERRRTRPLPATPLD